MSGAQPKGVLPFDVDYLITQKIKFKQMRITMKKVISKRYLVKYATFETMMEQNLTNVNVINETRETAAKINAVAENLNNKLQSAEAKNLIGSKAHEAYRDKAISAAQNEAKKIIYGREFDPRRENLEEKMKSETKEKSDLEKLSDLLRSQETRTYIRNSGESDLELQQKYRMLSQKGVSNDFTEALEGWPGPYGPLDEKVIIEGRRMRLEAPHPGIVSDIRDLEVAEEILHDLVNNLS
jgi:hypothetical protein